MRPGTAFGKVVDDRPQSLKGTWGVGPQIGFVGGPAAGLEQLDRRLVGMQHPVRQDLVSQRRDQGLQCKAARPDPLVTSSRKSGQFESREFRRY